MITEEDLQKIKALRKTDGAPAFEWRSEGENMSQADKIFIDMCKDILENGTSTEGEKVRPKWEDGSFAYTIKQ